jgi:O-antigen ligase
VLAVIAGFLLLLALRPAGIQRDEFIIALVFLGTALLSMLSAHAAPANKVLLTWLVSLAAYWLFRNTFDRSPENFLVVGVQVVVALWTLAAFGQALFGWPYVSSWFGAPIVTVYSTGLTIFSNYAAIALVPLLVWTLAFNLDRPGWRRSLLWMTGCAALYFTMSRSGVLALLIAVLVLVLRLRGHPRQMRGLALHAALALLAVTLAWAAPTRIDIYEPSGASSAGRWAKQSSGGDYSAMTRLVTLQVAATAVREYPLTGVGLGHFPDYYMKHHATYLTAAVVDPRVRMSPHNAYAQFVAEAGIPAFLALLVWLGWLLRRASMSTEPAALALHASILGMMVWLLFHDGFYDRLFWILLGCAAALGTKQSLLRSGA